MRSPNHQLLASCIDWHLSNRSSHSSLVICVTIKDVGVATTFGDSSTMPCWALAACHGTSSPVSPSRNSPPLTCSGTVCVIYFLISLGCSLGSNRCLPSLSISQMFDVSRCIGGSLANLTASLANLRSLRLAFCLSPFSLSARVQPTTGVLRLDLLKDTHFASQKDFIGDIPAPGLLSIPEYASGLYSGLL